MEILTIGRRGAKADGFPYGSYYILSEGSSITQKAEKNHSKIIRPRGGRLKGPSKLFRYSTSTSTLFR